MLHTTQGPLKKGYSRHFELASPAHFLRTSHRLKDVLLAAQVFPHCLTGALYNQLLHLRWDQRVPVAV